MQKLTEEQRWEQVARERLEGPQHEVTLSDKAKAVLVGSQVHGPGDKVTMSEDRAFESWLGGFIVVAGDVLRKFQQMAREFGEKILPAPTGEPFIDLSKPGGDRIYKVETIRTHGVFRQGTTHTGVLFLTLADARLELAGRHIKLISPPTLPPVKQDLFVMRKHANGEMTVAPAPVVQAS
jgi:hypothetical protein